MNIDDLGSTNDTVVNGERVTHAELQEGDRVLIGSNILEVAATGSTGRRRARPPAPVAATPR